MEGTPFPLVLVIVAGPQASGKSTLATALAVELRRQNERVALVELDQIAAMALPTLPSWEDAHHIFEETTGLWTRTNLTCVIAEGSGSEDEIMRLLRQAPAELATLTVVTTVALETAFSRAQADPTRGVSKEYGFLSAVYARWGHELSRMKPDLLLDTSSLTNDDGIKQIRLAIDLARSRVRPSDGAV